MHIIGIEMSLSCCIAEARRLMSGEKKDVLWIFDFDGTISLLVPDRSKAKLDPACKKLLSDLAGLPNQHVAVLSSRAFEDIIPRITIPGVCVGSGSGLEWQLPGGKRIAADGVLQKQLDQKRRELLPKLKSMGSIPGVEIEDKKWSVAIHFRKASVKSKKEVCMLMEDWTPVRHLQKFKGPEVIEVQLLPGIDKSYGVRKISDILHFTSTKGRLIYSGDDENDATAMQWVLYLKGIAFTVGAVALVPGSMVVDSPKSLAREIRKLAGLGETISNQNDDLNRGLKYESL